MSVSITHKVPIWDVAKPVIEELTFDGEAVVRVPNHLIALGMAVDLNELLFNLNPYIDREINIPDQTRPVVLRGNRYEGKQNQRVRFDIVAEDFIENHQDSYTNSTIITCTQHLRHKSRVSIAAVNNTARFRLSVMGRALKERGVELPEEKHKIVLQVAFQSSSGIPINTIFQDFPELGRFERSRGGRVGSHYPVSPKRLHLLDLEPYRFVQLPAFWFSWSGHTSDVLNVLAGTPTRQDSPKYYDTTIRHHQAAKVGAYSLIESLVDGKDPREVAFRFKCPVECVDAYFRLIFRTFRYFARQFSSTPYLANIVDSYNKEYASSLGRRRITPQELYRSIVERSLDISR